MWSRPSGLERAWLGLILALSVGACVNLSAPTAAGRVPAAAAETPYRPELVIQTGHTSLVNTVAFSPDGKILASGGGDNAIRLWDVRAGRQIKSLVGHTGYLLSVVFSPDGKTLASGSFDKSVRLWNVETGEQLKSLEGHDGFVFSVAFSPDGKILASGSYDNTVKLWDAATGRQLKTLAGHAGFVFSVAFSPDGKTLASGSIDKTIRLWDTATGVYRTLEGHANEISAVVFAPDGKTLASSSFDKSVRLWDVKTGQQVRSLEGHTSLVYSIAFSPDGKTLASADGVNVIKLWETGTGREVKSIEGRTASYIKTVAFSPDGRTLASGSGDNAIKLWSVETGEQVGALEGHAAHMLSVAISPDGRKIAGGSFDKTVKLWDVSGQAIKSLSLAGHDDHVVSVAFSPDGATLASGSKDNTIKFWDAQTGQLLKTLVGHSSWVYSVAFSPDGRTLASGSEDNTIKLWDTQTGAQTRSLAGHAKGVRAVAFSTDGRTLASGSGDKTVKLWNVMTGEQIKVLEGHTDEVLSVAFSPDKTTLASSGQDKTVWLWNVQTGRQLKSLTGQSEKITSVVFAPDGKTLASGSTDNTIALWDVVTGGRRSLEGHAKEVSAVAFAPDKNLLLSSSWDATVKFWRADAGATVATLIPLDRDDWTVITPEGRFDASEGALRLMHYVYGLEIIDLEQLKEAYYEPVLLQKLLGSSKELLRSIVPLKDVKLHPEILEQRFDGASGTLFVKLKSRGGGVGQVQVFVNGKRVVEDARDEKLKANPNVPLDAVVTLTVSLRGAGFLSGRDNTITVVTSNYLKEFGKGNIQSRGAEMVYVDKGREELTLPSLYAIVGGVSDYDGSGIDLRFAAKDAEDFSNALALGARRLFCPQTNPNCLDKVRIKTLSTNRQGPDEQPTKENFKKAFAEVAGKASPEDIVVIYLAGHGITLGTDTDTYLYLTKEARSNSKEDLAKVYQTAAISNQEMTDWLTPNSDNPDDIFVRARKLVLILDTCAAGNFAEDDNWKKDRDLTGDQIRAMDFLKGNTSTFILMGSAANRPSYEASKYNQGLLTYALLEGMRGAALQQERVDVRRLFDYAEQRVPGLAQEMTLEQKPIIKAPSGNTFPIGQMTDSEKRQINLPLPKPVMLRPILTTPPANDDDLKLIPDLRRRLDAASSYEVMRRIGKGEPEFIYVDDDSIPGGLRVAGTYMEEGDRLRIKALLRRDRQTLATLPEVFAVREKALEELLSAIHLELARNAALYRETTAPAPVERVAAATPTPTPAPTSKRAEPAPARGGSVAGKWNMVVSARGTEVPVSLELKQDGDAVSGTFSSHAGDGTVTGGNLSGNTLKAVAKLKVKEQIIELKLEGILDGDKLNGSLIALGLPPFSFKATRAK